MNTSFSKYVKQCKWGLSLDTAGSDYSAHNNLGASARTQCSALGGEPCPGRAAALGLPASPLEARGGQVRSAGGGGRGGPPDPLLPTREDIPARGGAVPAVAGAGTQRPWLGDAHAKLAASPVTCAQDKRPDRDSGLMICWEAAAWGWRQERAIFPKGWRGTASGRRGARHQLVQRKPSRASPARPAATPGSRGTFLL